MPRRSPTLSLTLLLALAGCASAYDPPVSTSGLNFDLYTEDLADCRTRAGQSTIDDPVLRDILLGAAVGGGLGTVIGGFAYANAAPAIWQGAGAGVAAGTVAGAVEAGTDRKAAEPEKNAARIAEQNRQIDACLDQRGYTLRSASRN